MSSRYGRLKTAIAVASAGAVLLGAGYLGTHGTSSVTAAAAGAETATATATVATAQTSRVQAKPTTAAKQKTSRGS